MLFAPMSMVISETRLCRMKSSAAVSCDPASLV